MCAKVLGTNKHKLGACIAWQYCALVRLPGAFQTGGTSTPTNAACQPSLLPHSRLWIVARLPSVAMEADLQKALLGRSTQYKRVDPAVLSQLVEVAQHHDLGAKQAAVAFDKFMAVNR